ncbi:MAG: diaminopimelate epimerase [Myxococcales bacterium]|nr:diaminopimelate epimerase [Myxococcales bacterium]
MTFARVPIASEDPNMHFWKYHGLGNDFIIVDRCGQPDFTPEQTRALCDRHTGIGADGILGYFVASAAPGEPELPRMRVYNSDGSVADMCGNGLRCFAGWLVDTGRADLAPFTVLTDAGPQRCTPMRPHVGPMQVRVNLGRPEFEPTTTVEVDGRHFEGVPARVGNPHFVMVRPADSNEAVAFGHRLSTHARFPRGANIEWLEVRDPRSATLVVWERGCGLTRACGTGGGAAASVAVKLGLMSPGVPLAVTLPGGTLTYELESDLGAVWMTGPAERVFEGDVA